MHKLYVKTKTSINLHILGIILNINTMFFIFHIDEFLNDWTIMKIMEVIVSLLTMIISVWGIQAVRKENKIWLIVYICTGGLLDLFVIALFLRQLIGGDNV